MKTVRCAKIKAWFSQMKRDREIFAKRFPLKLLVVDSCKKKNT